MKSTRPNYILYLTGGGRFANQLLTMAHFLAFFEENKHLNLHIFNLNFYYFAKEINPVFKNELYYLSIHKKWYLSLLVSVFKLLDFLLPRKPIRYILDFIKYCISTWAAGKTINVKTESFNLSPTVFEDTNQIVLHGWSIRCWELLEKHQNVVRNQLLPNTIYLKKAQRYFNQIEKMGYDFVIGVLVRQTDYRLFDGGKFFFETSIYEYWVKQLYVLYTSKGHKVAFLITSDEETEFNGLENSKIPFFIGTGNKKKGGHYMEDILELSMCNLIVSPPSTFATMAAFWGEKAILPLKYKEQAMNENDITSENIFQLRHDSVFKAAIN